MKKIITTAGICCALPIVILGVIWIASKDKDKSRESPSESSPLEIRGEEIPILNRGHVPEGTKVTDYNSNPPTSGKHWPSPANWGVYNEPVPDEVLVHNLEHGGIWISYKKDAENVDKETFEQLKAIANKFPQAVIITHRPENKTQFAIASWGRLHTSDSFDEEFATQFVKTNVNNSPEKLASLEGLAVAVGNPFPEFTLTEIDGTVLTNESFLGKPAIIWFTTEFCVPCQIGARKVSKLDDELGGSAFDVLVIFVDPRETEEDLASWRKRFARDDWMVAFDNFENNGANNLSAKVGLKYLDSKYLLDKNGVIKNIDFQIADERYLGIIKEAVEKNDE